ncbi:MAG: DNA mismatch repair protein MutS [Limimaricola sp.]|nr:DNA mismatch repair protein MutS [Limimaricola sp.]
MMAHYLELKDSCHDALLFYRMGDFYEMFFDDAVAASAALDIALTKRGQHLGQDIPMCGVPVHAAESYLQTLIKAGFRVAVCEQMEDPAEARKRGAKAVVRRDIVRLVTPGTLTEEGLLEARRHNFLAAYATVREDSALAWVDISTGAMGVTPCPLVRLGPELARLAPREVLVAEPDEAQLRPIVDDTGAALTARPVHAFDSTGGERRVLEAYGVATLDGFGRFDRAEVGALAALVDYLELTQRGKLPALQPPVRELAASVMQIDAATRKSLELTQGTGGGRAGSLLATIDRTVTAAGARLLERHVAAPLTSPAAILDRQAATAFLVEDGTLGMRLRDALRGVHDIDRAIARLSLDRGGPRDLAALRDTLAAIIPVREALGAADVPALLAAAARDLSGLDDLGETLDRMLVADPPLMARDGGSVAGGVNTDLDEARKLRDDGRSVIAAMQAEYAEMTGIASLKIKHNNVLGYHIETTAVHAEKMLSAPLNEMFKHRQTTANQVRFTTPALNETESRILNAGGRAIAIETEIFADLRRTVLERTTELFTLARAIAAIDVAQGLADLARADGWGRPMIDDSRAFAVTGGRHPVVAEALRRSGGSFVANDCSLSDAPIWLLTGPNMAGKSTFLRQNALIAILAQIGSFVPAESAHVGVVSQVFSRVGASDDLSRGRSTFMVEMVETAAILNQADDRALVILDEIGRGTSTYDGLSIAWATLEYLHDVNRCRAIFATHYHELTALSARLDGVENATMAVREWQGDVVFLHAVKQGTADRSYGVHVARLAGLPAPVVARARTVLDMLERGEREGGSAKQKLIDDLPLFSRAAATAVPEAATAPSEVEARLRQVLPDTLSPREALDLVYELRALVKD